MMLNSKKLIGWLVALLAWPVVGAGQEIIRHPKDATVCVGESAEFEVVITGGHLAWYINHATLFDFQNIHLSSFIERTHSEVNGSPLSKLIILKHDEQIINFNNSIISAQIANPIIVSENATLIYKTNQQSPAPGLIATVNNATAQFYWNELKSEFNLTTHYLFGVYDSDGNLLANQTTDTTHISYDLPDNVCHHLVFRVTADQCPDPEGGFVQNNATTFVYRKPDIDISPVTAEFDNNQTVLVSSTPDGGSAFQIVVTDMEMGNQTVFNGTLPFSYIPPRCGQHSLSFEVSPDRCAGEPGFTHSDTVSFTIPCPTTPTEPTEATEPEVTTQPSGTQASYPSLLLAVAAIIPMLKWQY